MHSDIYVPRDFSELDQRVLVVKHRVASQELSAHVRIMEREMCKQGFACRWSPGMIHVEAPTPKGGELKLGTYQVPKSGEQGLRPNAKQRRLARRARKQAQARTDRIVRALAFGPTHIERKHKQLAIQNARDAQEQATRLLDQNLELRSKVRKLQRELDKQ